MTDGSLRRVDAHHHVWDLSVRDQPWTAELPALRRSFNFAELQPSLVKHSIDATVLVQTISVPEETPEFLALASSEPLIAGVVGWTDLTAPDVSHSLAELRTRPGGEYLVGVRHQVQGESDPRWLCRPDVRAGLLAVGAAQLAYDLLILPSQLPAAIETVAALPDMRFVVDHAAKPPIASGQVEPWASHIRAIARFPNVAVKVSGLVTEADLGNWNVADLRPYVEVLLESFGTDRILFGSDWPVCLMATTYDGAIEAAEELTADLSADERASVFGGAAVSWYQLEGRNG